MKNYFSLFLIVLTANVYASGFEFCNSEYCFETDSNEDVRTIGIRNISARQVFCDFGSNCDDGGTVPTGSNAGERLQQMLNDYGGDALVCYHDYCVEDDDDHPKDDDTGTDDPDGDDPSDGDDSGSDQLNAFRFEQRVESFERSGAEYIFSKEDYEKIEIEYYSKCVSEREDKIVINALCLNFHNQLMN
ncbi:MAG: hypothetical protein BM556_02580 [Bacteriovorax sp. MedPE-SWde]|nr:MAG: hypothetical protein BM556_02580 [Bacteriovorax sp. MedPE-SWde]